MQCLFDLYIKSLREHLNLTQEFISQELAVAQNTFSNIWNAVF